MAKAPQLTGCINMFRVFLLAAAAVALAGCARSESAAEGAFRADDAKCKSYGPTQAPTPMWTAAWP
jgi:outer membrane lipoprotein SlyB